MMREFLLIVVTATLYAVAVVGQTACSSILVPTYSPPVVASGWQAQLVAGGLTKPRTIAFDSAGALLVLESGKGISRHSFTDNGGTCLAPDHAHMIVELPSLNHGLALSNNGRTIYASSVEAVFAWDYDAESGAVTGPPRTLIANMSNSDLVTRTLLVFKKQDGLLLVSRGGDEDDWAASQVIGNGFSQIRVFNLTNLTTTSTDPSAHYNFPTDGRVLGWGLRNSIGMAEHPVTSGIYAVENSVDRLERNGADLGDNNPGEELNFLGFLNDTATTTTTTTTTTNQTGTGTNFGYPQCFAVWDLAAIPVNEKNGLAVGMQIAIDGYTLTDQMCAARYTPPRLTFPAHYAPIDLIFDEGGETAYVSFRGSFASSSPVGYRLSSIAFDAASGEPVAAADSNDALTDILTNRDLTVCPGKCFRPTGLALDREGRLWMASDSTGEIYVLRKTGESGSGRFVGGDGGSGGGIENVAGVLWSRETELLSWAFVMAMGAWLVF